MGSMVLKFPPGRRMMLACVDFLGASCLFWVSLLSFGCLLVLCMRMYVQHIQQPAFSFKQLLGNGFFPFGSFLVLAMVEENRGSKGSAKAAAKDSLGVGWQWSTRGGHWPELILRCAREGDGKGDIHLFFIKQASSPCWEVTKVINISGHSSKSLDSLKNRFPLPSLFWSMSCRKCLL